MRHLFDLDSPVMSALSTLLDFFVLSILTLLPASGHRRGLLVRAI